LYRHCIKISYSFLKFGKCYVKYIMCVCVCVCVCVYVFVCARARDRMHARMNTHTRARTHTPNVLSDDITLCDTRKVPPSSSPQQIIRPIKSRSFPLNTVQYFEILFSERLRHFQSLSMLTPQFGAE
jgi:hypothetical protein